MQRLVLIESPYRGMNYERLELNLRYARACMRDSLLRGEFPFASHLLYTQKGILEDEKPEERELGISAGLAWGSKAELTAVYIDLVTDWKYFIGMARGVKRARKEHRPVDFRVLPNEVLINLDPRIIETRRKQSILIDELEALLRELK